MNLWQCRTRRLKNHYRAWRPRKEYHGEMIQYDGSQHQWFLGAEGKCTLLVAIDDATGQIVHAAFAENEGVVATFGFWQHYIISSGKPLKIYLDRLSTYTNLAKKGQCTDPEMTQFQRACKELDIELIYARSPQAKGRIERLFSTLQDRLVKELRLHKITSRAEAQSYLRDQFIPAFNQRFGVQPGKRENLHRLLSPEEQVNLGAVFSLQETRLVQNDFTVQCNGQWYQLDKQQPTLVRSKDMVTIAREMGGQVKIKKGRHVLSHSCLPGRPDRSYKPHPLTEVTRPAADHPWKTAIFKKQRLKEIARRRRADILKLPATRTF